MIRSLYTAASGLITSEAKQNVIMNNMANVNTTGYKSEKLSIKSFDEVMISNKDKRFNNKNYKTDIGTLSNGAEINGKFTNFEQGFIKDTNSSKDFALNGSGFFTVRQRDNNQIAYTRDGHFSVDNEGYLITQGGDYVLGRNSRTGAVEQIRIGNGEITADKLGNIQINGNLNYQFEIADFQNYDNLEKSGHNLYKTNEAPTRSNAFVIQNGLEQSNVNTVDEMADMMTTMRGFESTIKVLKTLDESLGKAVNEIARK
ncbi:flagellar hook-basal body complex protein [Clostridium ihumii]|uniref:flagellar hook-basal body complex protein n=1 Tax=Clostridium ihumii TaxID=1470356 RepID=UPI00058DDA19|nr:flagellar hook-basal body complex protein [Clostridium ihumii]